ncbi:enoyl-CoA hydratase/isomerase family protein [Frankia sp. AgKG'84/4]|uniref:enoyl-CoA hydratase/isomerase family protein n=1 Tax=Frankia sp. AgKG'84/4 TaxID=573490 RepID=UPI00200D198C|nr:enoyl-CoA hydratase-related protein [Frankia sp. AgKG'84/4]MCL9796325.1 enoyl-CoA hydratase-related protein [Frankia sp. AgKG'84/4]
MSPQPRTLTVERDGAVAIITLNRPDAANGISQELAAELGQAAYDCAEDPAVRAVLLTGAGRFFCAGGDVKEMVGYGERAGAETKKLADLLHRAVTSLARLDAPLVVAVNGTTAGAGVGLAIAGDLVLAADTATFTLAYTNVGLSPDGGTTFALPRLIGLRRTQELLYTNRRLSAAEALDWGLVTRVVPAGELAGEALAFAQRLAAGPADSHRTIRRLLLDTFDNSLETQLELEARGIAACAVTDGREGAAAFIDKRAPKFH